MSNLVEIEELLQQLLEQITEDTQYDEIADIFDLITQLHASHMRLVPFYEKLYTEMYSTKGAMYEVRAEIEAMKDECFQARLYELLGEGM
jgi:hypothetical protein